MFSAAYIILYLQVKAVEQLEELRDSSEVQTLMGQQKPVQHHIHVVLWEIRKKQGKRSIILRATVKYILYIEKQQHIEHTKSKIQKNIIYFVIMQNTLPIEKKASNTS